MKNLATTILFLVVSTFSLSAQNEKQFEIELDPLAYSIGGASGHFAFAWGKNRLQLGYGQLTLPENMQNHEDVSESFKAASFKYDFFATGNAKQGFFFGPTIDCLFLTYEDKSQNSFKENQVSLGLRAGYKFDLFKSNERFSGLYLTPWLGVSTFTSDNEISVGQVSFDRNPITIFPTVHLGWSF